MARKYQLKRRAESRDETRQRIVEATIDLHQTVGGAEATISAIAERAGVTRPTVYRHFPDERTLLTACTSHYLDLNPPPDSSAWQPIADPAARLRAALTEVYAYHRQTERMMTHAMHDLESMPVLREVLAPYFGFWELVQEILLVGWSCDGDAERLVRAAVGHALDFRTWRALAIEQDVTDEEMVELMTALVTAAARTAAGTGESMPRPYRSETFS
jgi:AcrR family transcriptional regulator